MAGEARLEGEVAEQARYWLKTVTGMLESRGIKYSLDAGTLLGIVREGRLLPWDNDMDLFVPDTEVEKLKKCALPFFLKGLRVRVETMKSPNSPLQPGAMRIMKLRNRHKLVHRGQMVLDIFVKHYHEGSYHWAEGRLDEVVYKSVPAHYLEDLDCIDFDGKRYPIPKDYDGYLTCRYGDWRTPVKEWDHRKDDLCLN